MSRLSFVRFNKYLVLLLGFLLIVIAVFVYAYMFRAITTESEILFIKYSDNGGLVLTGGTASSANAFKDYSYKIKDGRMLLRIRYVPLVSRWHPVGNFQIQLSKQELSGIREVYLYQDDDHKRLLWSQAKGIEKSDG